MFFDLFENRNGVGNGLFHSLAAVSVDLGLVDFTVGQTAGTADAAADAGHTFDKVCVELALALFEKSHSAGLDSVAGNGFKLEILLTVLLESLCHGVGKASAAGENSSEIGGVVKHALKGGYVDVLAVEKRLKPSKVIAASTYGLTSSF